MSRFRAATFHLLVCLAVAALLLCLFWFVWYPAPLFKAVGGLDIFLILLGIDVTLGPLLTLVVFKSGKKSLKFDLTVIATVQITALAYGIFTLLSGRPVYVAALGHRFDLIQASEIGEEHLKAAGVSLPLWGPQWVGVRKATDKKERENMLFSGLAGADYGHYPQYHAPLESMRDELLANAKPIAELRAKNIGSDDRITSWLSKRGYTDQTAVFQGLKARGESMAVILNAKTAMVVGIAPFKPWD